MTAAGSDRKTPAVVAAAAELRGFIGNILGDHPVSDSRASELLDCVDRLERLALLTAQRGITSALTHIAKTKRPTDTHCGRPSEVVNHTTEALAQVDLTHPALCRRCVNLYQQRQRKAVTP